MPPPQTRTPEPGPAKDLHGLATPEPKTELQGWLMCHCASKL